MNNHRQRLSQMCELFLYPLFCSDGHEDDITITVFPRNLAAATFRGRRLKYSTMGERAHCALFRINVNITYVYTRNNDDPLPHAARIRGRHLVH